MRWAPQSATPALAPARAPAPRRPHNGPMRRRFTIGEVSKRTGVPVKTLRFYSDEGLLPPAGRSASGYRLYGEDDIARLERIRTLRDAGLDLATIRAVLTGAMSLDEALRGRLRQVEAEIVGLRQVAAALRASLRSAPDEEDLKRLCAVTRLTAAGRRRVMEGFFEVITDGVSVDKAWMQGKIDESTPELPEEPTHEQLDAWIELCELVSDRDFLACLRGHAAEVWTGNVDIAASERAIDEATAAARDALARGVSPEGPEASIIIERFVSAYAAAMGRAPDQAFREWLSAHYRAWDPRAIRYGELLAILRGQRAELARPSEEWRWLIEAVRVAALPVNS
jgi:DNA-binding transcriptional MerR regulator